jgi:hypothetical protein
MRPVPLLRVALTMSASLLAACGPAPAEPKEVFNPVGTVSFRYQGARTGIFTASGQMAIEGAGVVPRPTAGATAYQQDALLNVFAFQPQAAERGDFFTMLLGQVSATGVLQFDPLACAQQQLPQCRQAFFIPDLDPQDLAGTIDLATLAERTYVLVLGNVTVTARTPMRVRGTFQGLAFRGGEQNTQSLLTVTNGQFDLPVRPEPPTP